MQKTAINPTGTGWAQGSVVAGAQRLLFISGQVPQDAEGQVPAGPAEQHSLAWVNLVAQLEAADMGVTNLTKVTLYMTDRSAIQEMIAARKAVLGLEAEPAFTVVIAELFDARWCVEIEAVAAA